MALDKYQTLMTVVDTGSLTQAASQLGCTQSAVSHCLDALEKELGFSVLTRSRAGVRLTNEGERLLLEWEEQLRQRYDALEPRSKVLRRREYDGAIGMIAYVLGREGACYEMMPMGIRNQVACRLHAMDRSQEQQADGTEA